MSSVSLLIVDDSATLRAVVKSVVRQDPSIRVVGEAADAMEARRLIKELDPDVITLDIEMPGMNGLDFLDKIMTLRPMPVIMLSSSTAEGSDSAVTALSNGAFHCLQKPSSGNIIEALSDLPGLVRAAAASSIAARKPRTSGSAASGQAASAHLFKRNALIAIGSSTGGVDALCELLADFPANCPPVVIAQHMPAAFIQSFADRLDRTIAPDVKVAREGETLQPGQIRFAPGGDLDMALSPRTAHRIRLVTRSPDRAHCPSVDVLLSSVAAAIGKRAVGTILTGMGRDGAAGLLEMRESGARTFGQDRASSTVYGMPKVAFELGAVGEQLPLSDLADAMLDACSRLASPPQAAP
ncbi:chemotaxis response regulator protein-glutamate methylesterase [uncultured Algimonas sp.]|uniref:protein-glutamate methylesterase/protein-glutamine glutaminase n=1 Tax=uncultured Algimonas sp. TaxID=1547920 RepID=UPI00262133E4|nr:chemotaxis response regulator protein-glutamate methylesterase [uncultured Algimonas sp.]